MATITLFQNLSLDGVMQGPGRPDEDTRGGFAHGGWSIGYQDDIAMRFAAELMSTPSALLFGRRSYEDMLAYWTGSSEPNPFAEALVNTPKFVVSRSTGTALAWPNSTLLAGDAVEEVARLREDSDLPLTVMGSGELVRALHPAGLIDEYVLQIHPVVLGSGTRLFGPADRADLELVQSLPTGTGVVIARYRAAA